MCCLIKGVCFGKGDIRWFHFWMCTYSNLCGLGQSLNVASWYNQNTQEMWNKWGCYHIHL
jgi:hypothetical protein